MAEREWNQSELAEKSGVDQGTISAILTRRTMNPKIDTLQKIAHAFGKDLSIFQVESEKPNPTPDQREKNAQSFFRASDVPDRVKNIISDMIEYYTQKAKKEREEGGKSSQEDTYPDL